MDTALRTTWEKSSFGMGAALIPRARIVPRVGKLLDGHTHIAEIGAGLCATADALRKAYPSLVVEASDLEGQRLDTARQAFPDLTIRGEDGVSVARRLSDHQAVFVAINVLGNMTLSEVLDFLGLMSFGSVLLFRARGLEPRDKDLSRPRQNRLNIGYDHNYTKLLVGFEKVEGGNIGSVYDGAWVKRS